MTPRRIASSLLLSLSMTMTPLMAIQAADYNIKDTFSDSLRAGGNGPEMVVISDGHFVLGGGSAAADGPGQVKFEYLLAVGATEVTMGQYRHFLISAMSGSLRDFPEGNDNLPVTGLSFDEAEAYVDWLSRQTGHYYRLPSASEWEYAARAGTTTAYSWGNEVKDNMASCLTCKSEFSGTVAPVKSFPPNDWGLYDMHGNVWEWTKDCIDPNMAPPGNGMPVLFGNCDMRELRGGSAKSDDWSIRAASRGTALRTSNIKDLGFRVVMDIPEE